MAIPISIAAHFPQAGGVPEILDSRTLLALVHDAGFPFVRRACFEGGRFWQEVADRLAGSGTLYCRSDIEQRLDPSEYARAVQEITFVLSLALPEDHGAIASIACTSAQIEVSVWSSSVETARDAMDLLAAQIPTEKPPDESNVATMRFWYEGKARPKSHTRLLECSPWKDVRPNYLPPVQHGIDEFLALERPDQYGRIIIWSGPPGTGKTWALRSVLLELAGRADIDVVTDPERFFRDPHYAYAVLMRGLRDGVVHRFVGGRRPRPAMLRAYAYRPEADLDDERDQDDVRRFRLIVLEDAAELVMAGCRERGPGFTRLVNLSDGLVGQGLRFVLLFTANEDLGRIDPAVLRSGRCLQQLSFAPLPWDTAQAWLAARFAEAGRPPPEGVPQREYVLADLYAILNGRPLGSREEQARVGFEPRP